MKRVGLILAPAFQLLFPARSYNFGLPNSNNNAFSLAAYQKARAKETSHCLDASRFHFQILFVDNNNSHGRLAEGVLARVAEYTIESSSNAPRDAAAPEAAVAICESLGLCSTRSTAMGTSFGLNCLDEYDLIISLDDEIQDMILRSLSLENQLSYGPKCRLLSEFLSIDFCDIHKSGQGVNDGSTNDNANLLLDMLDSDLRERAFPYFDLVKDCSSSIFSSSTITWEDVYEPRMIMSDTGAAIPNTNGFPQVEAAIVLASYGLSNGIGLQIPLGKSFLSQGTFGIHV